MRKLYFLLFILFSIPLFVRAVPGDTTWVQVQNGLQLTHYGAFDTAVTFPSGSATYRKVYLVFTLGTYNCPSGAQYCHQWDYDVHNILMTPAGDTIELSRFITPFATSGTPGFGPGWSYRYIFDVTDYYPLLKGNAAFRIFYSGYSFGFTANVRFAFVEGTPERNVLGISKLWGGGYTYGKASDPIDSHIKAVTRVAPAGTQATELKVNITGHGADANGCCEFASNNYHVKVNGIELASQPIWRADCGFNELYPQGGTWVYNRGNWCPGAIVNPNSHLLTNVSSGAPYTIDVDFDPYTNSNTNYGSYNVQANVIYYGSYNKTVDASLEDIITPSDFEGHFRENPSNGQPVITIRNSGSTSINSMQIVYGVKDSAMSTYTFTGSFAPGAQSQFQLPELPAIRNLSLQGATGTYQFVARIANVNGAADNDAHNDTLSSAFKVAPTWPNTIIIYMKTNADGQGGVSESSWTINDAAGNTIATRTGATPNTVYYDTVGLQYHGMYTLTVTDAGCDGMNWWAGTQGGQLVVRDWATFAQIPLHGNIYSGQFHDDFGCGFTQAFSTAGYAAGVANTANPSGAYLKAYPNPAHNAVKVDLYGLKSFGGQISVVDFSGRTVLTKTTTGASTMLGIESLAAGIYNVVYQSESGLKVATRLTIAK